MQALGYAEAGRRNTTTLIRGDVIGSGLPADRLRLHFRKAAPTTGV